MRYPIIRVRDKLTGEEHIVGTDSHDTLYIGDDGGIHYYNLQNGEGTGKNGDYEFMGVDDEYALGPEIEFVRIEPDNSGIIAEIKDLLESWDFRAMAAELESGYDRGVLVELVELCEKLTGAKSPKVNWLDQKDANAAKVERVLPPASEVMKEYGWRVDVGLLENIQKKVKWYDETISLKEIELILLAYHGINAPEGEESDV